MAKTALVVGATGIIGSSILKHISSLEDWTAVGISRHQPEDTHGADYYVEADLLKEEEITQALQTLPAVTHIFYAAYQDYDPLSKEQITVNTNMLRSTVQAAEAASDQLERVVLMQGAKVYGAHISAFKTPARESDPRHMPPNFYYNQEDYLRNHQKGKSWSWTILRPDVVCGYSVGTPMNLSMVIAVYASISKELGLPLRFPGKDITYRSLAQVTDAGLLARCSVWAALHEPCAFETFNITNGDFFRWEHMWPAIAREFQMDTGPVQTITLSDFMPLQQELWEEMQEKYSLQNIPFDKLAAWPFGDFIFNVEYDVMSDTNKVKQFGFTEVVNSDDMFCELLREFQEQRLIPDFSD